MTAPAPLVSVSIDLDSLACYERIHALDGAPPSHRPPSAAVSAEASRRHVILRRCLPRFRELFRRRNIRATLFVIGQDVAAGEHEDPVGRDLLAEMAAEGHELASHSFTHPYDLTRLTRAGIAEEIDRAQEAISAVSQSPVVGFRAPGYEINNTVIELLAQRNYLYDSSVFPSIPYYAAKAAVMGTMRVLGKRSGSILGSPKVLGAPTKPYRPEKGQAYRAAKTLGDIEDNEGGKDGNAHNIKELPISLTRFLRVPIIGTAVVTAPALLRRYLIREAVAQPFFNFELHGIDLADPSSDGFSDALIAKQPDLRVPLERKLRALEALFEATRTAGARFVPLREAAQEIEPINATAISTAS